MGVRNRTIVDTACHHIAARCYDCPQTSRAERGAIISGIIALALLAAALLLVTLFTLAFPKRARLFVWALVIGCAVAYPSIYKLSPSYERFQALCERPDRFVVHKVIPVRSVYYDASVSHAYRFSQKYHFESADIKEGRLGYFRIKVNDEWQQPTCQSACADPSILGWEKNCLPSCITKTPIDAPEFEPKFNSTQTYLLAEKLTESRIEVSAPDGSKLATSSAYTYYPYGTGWASLLGAGSGTPPSKECEHDRRLWDMPFLKPMDNR
jgi:hypothetical protein